MLEEASESTRSFHSCERRDCTRVFRDIDGYSDWINRQFDQSRALLRTCAACGATAYLAEVDGSRKTETWECQQTGCEFAEEVPSPSSR
jgi:hypothetical protein